MRIVVALVVWVVAAVCAVEVASVVSGSIHTGGSSSDPTSMTATDPGSMFRTKNFTTALDQIRSHVGPGAKLDNFVVYPGYVSVTAVTQNGESDITYYSGGRYVQDDSGGSPGADSLFSLSQIKPTIPTRFAARIARLGHMPLSQLHYMVAMVNRSKARRLSTGWQRVEPVRFWWSGRRAPPAHSRCPKVEGLHRRCRRRSVHGAGRARPDRGGALSGSSGLGASITGA
jgi:hypothetical protein